MAFSGRSIFTHAKQRCADPKRHELLESMGVLIRLPLAVHETVAGGGS
jgi:hypothetical protein